MTPHHDPRTPLSTPQRVRDRVGPEAAGLDDPLLLGLIEEHQALVEGTTRRRYRPGDPCYELACTATTNLAAAAAAGRLRSALGEGAEYRIGKFGVSKRAQLQAWARLVEQLRLTGQEALRILERDARARRFTAINGGD